MQTTHCPFRVIQSNFGTYIATIESALIEHFLLFQFTTLSPLTLYRSFIDERFFDYTLFRYGIRVNYHFLQFLGREMIGFGPSFELFDLNRTEAVIGFARMIKYEVFEVLKWKQTTFLNIIAYLLYFWWASCCLFVSIIHRLAFSSVPLTRCYKYVSFFRSHKTTKSTWKKWWQRNY